MSHRTAAGRLLRCIEVLGLGVMHDQGIGGLLRVQLQLLGERDTDARRVEQPDQHRSLLQVRTGRVTERVARPAIALPQDGTEVFVVIGAEAQLCLLYTSPSPRD